MTDHVLVVGGGRGIGRACVDVLCAEGKTVHVLTRRGEGGEGSVRAHTLVADLRDLDACVSRVLGLPPLSGLVFCQRYRSDSVVDAWHGELLVSLTAVRRIVDALLHRDAKDSGTLTSVVALGSLAAGLVASEQPPGYHVAKAGLQQLMRYYAVTVGGAGVRFNTVVPGAVLKPESAGFYDKNPRRLQAIIDATPLRRMGAPVDIANTVKFLLSEEAAFITGQSIVVDGGLGLTFQGSLSTKGL